VALLAYVWVNFFAHESKGCIGPHMKIIFLISNLATGGAERVATILCNAWAKRGHTVTLIPTYSAGGKSAYKISHDVETIFLADVVGVKGKNLWSYAQRLAALRGLIRPRQPDVIVSFLANVNVAAVLSTMFMKTPLIICERIDPSSRPMLSPCELSCRLTYRFADMLTVQTDSIAQKAAAIYPKLSTIRTVPNPLARSVPPPVRNIVRTRKILLSLGRLAEQKRIDRIINAFAEVAPRFDDWDLHIYGEGPLESMLFSMIVDRGLQDRAFLRGLTSESSKVMAAADAFVIASDYEGFPNALLEAMSVGLPCIATDCPSGPREITANGHDAVLVPLHDQAALVSAMDAVMRDQTLRISLGKRAYESAWRKFSLETVLDRWDELFIEVGAIDNSNKKTDRVVPTYLSLDTDNG
jgi:GalNAc-alpha-(1->4)-GalNAc-alpha-(1->3)-diNAcBac-PP-undecaprenol alpha-1,4-N-acetyl-D-galactosaminyltransferase